MLPMDLSLTTPWATILPLSIELIVTLIEDTWKDYKRHISDKEINNKNVFLYDDEIENFKNVKWWEVEVDNFVRLGLDE